MEIKKEHLYLIASSIFIALQSLFYYLSLFQQREPLYHYNISNGIISFLLIIFLYIKSNKFKNHKSILIVLTIFIIITNFWAITEYFREIIFYFRGTHTTNPGDMILITTERLREIYFLETIKIFSSVFIITIFIINLIKLIDIGANKRIIYVFVLFLLSLKIYKLMLSNHSLNGFSNLFDIIAWIIIAIYYYNTHIINNE